MNEASLVLTSAQHLKTSHLQVIQEQHDDHALTLLVRCQIRQDLRCLDAFGTPFWSKTMPPSAP